MSLNLCYRLLFSECAICSCIVYLSSRQLILKGFSSVFVQLCWYTEGFLQCRSPKLPKHSFQSGPSEWCNKKMFYQEVVNLNPSLYSQGIGIPSVLQLGTSHTVPTSCPYNINSDCRKLSDIISHY